MMIFFRSLRVTDFKHTHYARWISVHLRDMVTLAEKLPTVYQDFLHGNFTVNKTGCVFSNNAIDQAHKQNNARVKCDGGVVGLTHKPAALYSCGVSGPEMAHIIEN